MLLHMSDEVCQIIGADAEMMDQSTIMAAWLLIVDMHGPASDLKADVALTYERCIVDDFSAKHSAIEVKRFGYIRSENMDMVE